MSWPECLAYGHSIADWPAFPDSGDALRYLKQHFALVILSNVDNESFAHSNARLGVAFDAICTAADIGSHKPAKRNFVYMLADLGERGIKRSDIRTSRKASSTIMCPPTASVSQPAGSTADMAMKVSVPRARRAAFRKPTFASRAWRPWLPPTAPSSHQAEKPSPTAWNREGSLDARP